MGVLKVKTKEGFVPTGSALSLITKEENITAVAKSWDFGKTSMIPDSFRVRGDASQLKLANGCLQITNSGLNKNVVDIVGFESDVCRLDYWATYPTNEDAWNGFVAWSYASWWDTGDNNVGIWSAITSEIDVFEQGMPSGATHETAANNIYVGSDIHVYEVWDASGGYTVGAGVEHKFSLILNKNIVTWLFDDVAVRTVDASAYEEMPLTSEYTFERNTLLLPHWFNIYTQTKDVSDGSNTFSIRKIAFSTVKGDVINPTSISLSNDYIIGSAPVGAKLLMIKSFKPENVTNKYTTWESTNEAVATVSVAGVVSCLAEGSCVIRCTGVNGIVGEYPLTVSNSASVPCRKIEVAKTSVSLAPLESETISTKIYPSYTSDSVRWESSNESVVKVASGVLSAVAVGEATVTMFCGEHSQKISVNVASAQSLLYDSGEITGTVKNAFTHDFTKGFSVIWDVTPTSQNFATYWTNSSGNNSTPRIDANFTSVKIMCGNPILTIEDNWTGQQHKVGVTFDADTMTYTMYVDGVNSKSGTISAASATATLASGTLDVNILRANGSVKVWNYARSESEMVAGTTI